MWDFHFDERGPFGTLEFIVDFVLINDDETSVNVIQKLNDELVKFKPDLLVVQGDTSSAFAGALAAFHLGIPIAHVEAGLRTDDINEPFPEEANRRLISQLSTLHFAPTRKSAENLKKEGILKRVFITGNTVIDILLEESKKKSIDLEICGLGGEKMKKEGVKILQDTTSISAIGIWEALPLILSLIHI